MIPSIPDLIPYALVILALYTLVKAVTTVRQGFSYTVERLGKYTNTLTPGFHLIVPYIDSIGRRVNMMEQVLDIPPQEIISADNAMVKVDGLCFFVVVNAAKASYEVNDLDYALRNLAMTNIRTVLGAMELDKMLSARDDINNRLLTVVDAAAEPWGVKVTRIEIKNIEPPMDLVDAMANQMKAERNKRASILQAEGERQAAILRAEGEKQSAILEAEGRREAAFRDAEARERAAQAEAEATRMVSEAIAKGDSQALSYFVAQKYVEALQSLATAENQKVLMLPVEATGVLGALEGVRELLKHNGGKDA